MSKSKRSLLDKILIVSATTFALFMIIFWLMLKRNNKDYYIPKGYEGWVSIKHGWPDAGPFPEKNGVFQISISDSGYAETSVELNQGWGRDRYFWVGGGDTIPIPNSVESDGEIQLHIHGHRYEFFSHESILPNLSIGTDTLLWDGTKIEVEEKGEVSYQTGDKIFEFFYLSTEPKSIMFVAPENPNRDYLKSVEDYRLRK